MDSSFDKALETAKQVVIAGHHRPDGDAIGACYSLASYISSLGKDVKVLLEDYAPYYDDVIPGRKFLYTDDYAKISPDMFIAVDTSSPERLALAGDVFWRSKVTAVFDHHLEGVDAGRFDYVMRDVNTPSTTMLIYSFLSARINIATLDKDIASAIYAGLVYDTGGFRHPSTTPDSLEVAADLIKLGIDFSKIYSKILYERPRDVVGVYGLAIQRTSFAHHDTIAYTSLSLANRAALGAHPRAHPSGVIDYLMNIRGINTALYVSESELGVYEVSLRSHLANVAEVAQSLGGGGHKAAAGCVVHSTDADSLEGVLQLLLDKLIEALKLVGGVEELGE